MIMYFFVPDEHPEGGKEAIEMKPGAKVIIGLGILTIATAVSFHQFLHLPPFMGMMFGLGLLMIKGYYLKRWGEQKYLKKIDGGELRKQPRLDVFSQVKGVEFDTLLFFFGVLTAVGALQYIGYLALVSESMYGNLGPTYSNIIVGLLSAIVDNIPVMYAVLKMDPTMGIDQWLLITLTAGVGGSLLSIGSAAGVAVMGVERENYNFMSHLKWAPAIALGYAGSIICWYFVTTSLR
jgi:Na+/H+ antiporter NhaD/arsenite permease-like protein